MESILGRYKNLIWLVAILFLQVLGLAVQVKRSNNDAQDTRLIRVWAVGAVTPFERAMVWVENGAGNLWHNYFYLRGVRSENRQLKEQIEQMRLEQVRLNEDAAQGRRLQKLLAFKEQFVGKTVAAQVIGSSGTDSSRVIYIDRGDDFHIERDMAVITADGIVGKVLEAYSTTAKVLLINDQSSGVGAILSSSRLQGFLVGGVNGEVNLNGIMSDEQVPAGETVLTSGGDQIFPKGLPVGTVEKVSVGKDLFLNIRVKPAANLSKLEEVLVLVEKQERQATAEGNGQVRAADILAQRLPSVPDKPVAAPGTTPANPLDAQKSSTAAAPKPKNVTPGTVSSASTQVPKNTAANASPGISAAGPAAKIADQAPAAPKTKPSTGTPSANSPASVKVDAPAKPTTTSPKPAIVEQKPASPPDGQPTPPPDANSPQ